MQSPLDHNLHREQFTLTQRGNKCRDFLPTDFDRDIMFTNQTRHEFIKTDGVFQLFTSTAATLSLT